MGVIAIGIGIVVALVLLALFVHERGESKRSLQFEEHLDDNFEAITEHRIRRNYHQGG